MSDHPYSRRIILGALLLGLGVGRSAWADMPPCADRMMHAPPGQPLSAEALSVNRSCIGELSIEAAAADLKAHIAEAERKMHEKPAAATSLMQPPPFATGVQTLGAPAAPNPHGTLPTHSEAALPRIVMITSDGGHSQAVLRLSDGTTPSVTKGSLLPDGTVVHAVTEYEVVIERGAKLVPLAPDDGTAPLAPATGQARPDSRIGMLRP
ncbi:MAG: type IV pilus biogenesis protein PilP [Gluconacetobacter sp.]